MLKSRNQREGRYSDESGICTWRKMTAKQKRRVERYRKRTAKYFPEAQVLKDVNVVYLAPEMLKLRTLGDSNV